MHCGQWHAIYIKIKIMQHFFSFSLSLTLSLTLCGRGSWPRLEAATNAII